MCRFSHLVRIVCARASLSTKWIFGVYEFLSVAHKSTRIGSFSRSLLSLDSVCLFYEVIKITFISLFWWFAVALVVAFAFGPILSLVKWSVWSTRAHTHISICQRSEYDLFFMILDVRVCVFCFLFGWFLFPFLVLSKCAIPKSWWAHFNIINWNFIGCRSATHMDSDWPQNDEQMTENIKNGEEKPYSLRNNEIKEPFHILLLCGAKKTISLWIDFGMV